MDIKVPDIGDFTEVPVVSVLVSVGDTVAAEDPLIELESDKATMEVPSPRAGTVKEIKVAEGDKVSEGSVIMVFEAAESGERGGQVATAAGVEEIRDDLAGRTFEEFVAGDGLEDFAVESLALPGPQPREFARDFGEHPNFEFAGGFGESGNVANPGVFERGGQRRGRPAAVPADQRHRVDLGLVGPELGDLGDQHGGETIRGFFFHHLEFAAPEPSAEILELGVDGLDFLAGGLTESGGIRPPFGLEGAQFSEVLERGRARRRVPGDDLGGGERAGREGEKDGQQTIHKL
jgi:pyruvate/2-oxoglutarate dehydrogenase complex dihydrolipoamide acyltransferase (E2) component